MDQCSDPYDRSSISFFNTIVEYPRLICLAACVNAMYLASGSDKGYRALLSSKNPRDAATSIDASGISDIGTWLCPVRSSINQRRHIA